ncbi:MAG: hypothetical protein II670_05105, partial [Alphaproteobacteria bacterium]|nr:hypothetical protein [Alphaproteobacteria bacterium]
NKQKTIDIMKAIKTYLICYTAWGSICFRKEYPTKSQAVKDGREMVANGYAGSYVTKPIK